MLSYLEEYREYMLVQLGRQRGSVDTYERNIEHFAKWLAGAGRHSQPESITRGDIEAYMKALFFDFKITNNNTRAQKLSAIRSFLDFMIHEDIIGKNAAAQVASPKVQKRMPVKFSLDQLAKIFAESTPDPSKAWQVRDYAILKVMYAAGLRVSEIASLDLEDLNDTGRLIRLTVTGKGGKQRVITLKANPAAALRRWILFRLTLSSDNTALFISSRHQVRLSSEAINAVLKKYASRVGISDVEAFVHKMRATCFADMFDAAMEKCPKCGAPVSREDIFTLAAFAGHSDPKTMNDYVTLSEKIQKQGLPDQRHSDIDRLALKYIGEKVI